MNGSIKKRFAATLTDVAIPVAAAGISTLISYVSTRTFGPRFLLPQFFFLLAVMGSGARGYLSGVLACVLLYLVAPYATNPQFRATTVNPGRLALGIMIAVLVSTMVSARRRSEKLLRSSNEDLDRRVKERTSALELANSELASREEELNETKAHLNEVLDSVSESFLALDREWRFTYANKRILTALGAPAEDVIGKVLWDLFPGAANTAFYPEYHRVMRERVAARFEVEYKESGVWYEVAAHPTREGLAAYVADITERKRYEAAIGHLASIIESSADAIVSADLEGTILTWNSSAERIYGFAGAEMVGKSMRVLVPGDRLEEENELRERVRRGEQAISFETIRVRSDSSQIPVSLTLSPIRNREGMIVGASHIARDITELRDLNAQIQQAQKLESLGVLAGGIAHDFNNLLVGILGNASLALDTVYDENRELLHEIVRAGKRAADLTSQLLAYAGKGRFYVQPVDLSELVSEISSLIRTSIPPSVTLHLELAEGLPPIEGDSGQIQQVAMNLVINAAEAIPEGQAGEVFVRTSLIEADAGVAGVQDLLPGRYIALEVRDTGCGMDAATQARIFDPFFTTKFTGRGLGLSAVLGIVGGHKGVLKVESEPGVGTLFRVFLPAAAMHVAAQEPVAESPNLKGEGMVLVVDDEQMVRKVARSALERMGFSVLEAEDGHEAVSVFSDRRSEIGVIVLDLKMPNMGGEEALSRVREICHDIPVILSSGFSEAEALRRFEGQRIAGFVQKPYTPDQLGEKVRAVSAGRA